MLMHPSIAAAAISATLFLGVPRQNSFGVVHAFLSPGALETDACSLLTEAEASAALEAKSLPGKRLVESSPKACIWSDDAKQSFSNRRVTVQYITVAGFNFAKSHDNPKIKIESVSGVGDEAYYEIFKSDSPFLAVRKGTLAIQVRILNGLKFKALSLDEEKARELALAKAAVAKL
jgi:hypothetical protein